ncbi:TrkA C-terminal domain-containing protein [Campylobacterota bacterium]
MKNIIVFGYNEYAKEIISNFTETAMPVMIYVIDELNYRHAKEDGYEVELVELDDDWLEIGERFDVSDVICFCALDDDAQNVFLTISLRAEYSQLYIIALATSKDSADKLHLAGANKAVAKLETTANVIVESLEKPAVVKIMNDILYHNKELKLAEYTINESSVLANKRLDDITLHHEFDIIILAVADQELDAEFSFTPQGHNHAIDAGDVLVVMGRENDLEKFEKAIS